MNSISLPEEYARKLVSAREIAEKVENGWNVCADIAAAIPPGIMNELGLRAQHREIDGVHVHTLLDLVPANFMQNPSEGRITPVTWFSGKGLKYSVNHGFGDLMPCYYRDMPSLFRDHIDVDAFVAAVSPMDCHGYFSTGVVGSNSFELIKKAKHIFLEVNENMPRAVNAPQIHISQVEALCENNVPMPVMPAAVIDDVSRTIGNYIAEEVPDGAAIQLGIGAVPEAVGFALRDKHDLGIHTELFTDSMVELIECGAVTNERKGVYKGKTVATLAFGSKRIYDFINDNPTFLFLPVNIVNDPRVIAQNDNFISVNAALEVDFYGQVCAESIGTSHVSGTGGQADYVRGAVLSKGGKSFIAFPSTAKNGTISRIKATLSPGALVSTSKNDVDFIVTEYGKAKLRGKTLSQRVKALINIAHPDFRDELTYQAKKQNILI